MSVKKLVCPSEEELALGVQTNVPCPIQGCHRVLAQSSALRIHLIKAHRVIQSEADFAVLHGKKAPPDPENENVAYHCPHQTCDFNMGQRHFTKIIYLRQHYMKRHAEKKHKCSKCGFGYGLERDKRVHERNCGNTYTCDICGVFYSTRENLQLHCRSKSHPFPERYNLKPKTNKHMRQEPIVPVVTSIIRVSEPESLTSSSEEEENRNNDDTKLLSSVCCASSNMQNILDLPRLQEPRPPQTFILPRPTAVIMPVQLQVGPADSAHLAMATAKPTGLILVSDLCTSGKPRITNVPKDSTKPKPLYPKSTDGDVMLDDARETSSVTISGSRKSTISIGTQTIRPFYRRKRDLQTQASKATLKPVTVQSISRIRNANVQLSPRAQLKRQVTTATSVPADKRSRQWIADKGCDLENALIAAAIKSEESTGLNTSHTETQTLSLWDDLQGALNESISTQTLDSFLADASYLSESGHQRVEQTKEELRRLAFLDTDTTSQSVQTTSAMPDMSTMAIQTQSTDAMSVQTDTYGLPDLHIFTQGTQTISGRFVPLQASNEQFVQTQLSPVLFESIGIQAMEDLVSHSCQTLLGNTSSVQCGPDEPLAWPLRAVADGSMQTPQPFLDSHQQSLVSVATQNTPEKLTGLETVQRGCQISTAMEMSTTQTEADFLESVETQTTLDDLDLPELLTAASQTHAFDTEDMQTQTMDDMFDQLISNMHTQTPEDFLNDLGFDTLKGSTSTPDPDHQGNMLDEDHSFATSYALPSPSLSSVVALGSLGDDMVLGAGESLMDAEEQSNITGLEQQALFPNFTLPLSHGKHECDN